MVVKIVWRTFEKLSVACQCRGGNKVRDDCLPSVLSIVLFSKFAIYTVIQNLLYSILHFKNSIDKAFPNFPILGFSYSNY